REQENHRPGVPVGPLPAALDPLVQVRPLPADGGGLAVASQDLGLVREGEEPASDALDDGRKTRVGIGGVSRPAGKEGVARKQVLAAKEADAAGRVVGRVHRDEFVLAKTKSLAILDAMVRLERDDLLVRRVIGELGMGFIGFRSWMLR